MNKFLTFVLAGSMLAGNASSSVTVYQGKDKARDQIKTIQAKDNYFAGEYRKALELYRELLGEHKEDPTINYRIGRCLEELNNLDVALEYFERAYKIKPDVEGDILFHLGKAYQRSGQVDKAVECLENFKKSCNPKKLKEYEVEVYLTQCKTAKELTSKPVDVKIENVGKLINSEFDDYAPSFSADGKTMIFTSRRSDTKGGEIDAESDNKFFEDIYISTWNEEKNQWDEAEPIKGSLNTEGHDASLSLSPDGHTIFVYRNLPEETRSGDIFVSKQNSTGKWGAPHSIGEPINSSYFESSASLSADGNFLYFVSERKGGVGNGDIWVSKKISKSQWGEPVNLGAVVNTEEDEVSVFIHPDGKTLFFSSKGHNSMGGYDIFKCVKDDKGNWSKPENVGYPINTFGDDIHFSLSTDNKTAYYSTVNADKGLGERDIYKVDMSKYAIVKGTSSGPALSIIQGKLFDSNTGIEMEAEVVVKDAATQEVVSKTTSTDGSYFFTVPAGKKYLITVSKSNYKTANETLEVGADKNGGTITVNKNFLLEKN